MILELVEVYVASDPIESSAVAGILEAAGLDVRVRDMAISPYPVTVGPLGEKRIAVPGEQAEEARALLIAAAQDGILGHADRIFFSDESKSRRG
jgi:hypothetical protein